MRVLIGIGFSVLILLVSPAGHSTSVCDQLGSRTIGAFLSHALVPLDEELKILEDDAPGAVMKVKGVYRSIKALSGTVVLSETERLLILRTYVMTEYLYRTIRLITYHKAFDRNIEMATLLAFKRLVVGYKRLIVKLRDRLVGYGNSSEDSMQAAENAIIYAGARLNHYIENGKDLPKLPGQDNEIVPETGDPLGVLNSLFVSDPIRGMVEEQKLRLISIERPVAELKAEGKLSAALAKIAVSEVLAAKIYFDEMDSGYRPDRPNRDLIDRIFKIFHPVLKDMRANMLRYKDAVMFANENLRGMSNRVYYEYGLLLETQAFSIYPRDSDYYDSPVEK